MINTLRVSLGSNPIANLPDADAVFAAFVGESVTLSFAAPLAREDNGTVSHAPTIAVGREPSGSALTFTDGSATPTHAGLHVLTCRNGGLPARTVRFVALPSAALTHPPLKEPHRRVTPERVVPDPNPRSEAAVREALRLYVVEQARAGADLSALDTLDANQPLPLVDWRSFT